jgi:hypothetical protein
MYIFGLAATGMLIVACVRLYTSHLRQPVLLNDVEFSQKFIHEKYFRLSSLADADSTIQGRTFEDCWIYGPAVIYGDSSTNIRDSSFAGSSTTVFIPVLGVAPGPGTGVIFLKDCRFRHCHFIRISILADPAMIDRYRSDNYGSGTAHPSEKAPQD